MASRLTLAIVGNIDQVMTVFVINDVSERRIVAASTSSEKVDGTAIVEGIAATIDVRVHFKCRLVRDHRKGGFVTQHEIANDIGFQVGIHVCRFKLGVAGTVQEVGRTRRCDLEIEQWRCISVGLIEHLKPLAAQIRSNGNRRTATVGNYKITIGIGLSAIATGNLNLSAGQTEFSFGITLQCLDAIRCSTSNSTGYIHSDNLVFSEQDVAGIDRGNNQELFVVGIGPYLASFSSKRNGQPGWFWLMVDAGPDYQSFLGNLDFQSWRIDLQRALDGRCKRTRCGLNGLVDSGCNRCNC